MIGVTERVSIDRELSRISQSGKPVLVGPWLGEVGFELLYWIPFLSWAVSQYQLDPRRVVAVSRGGPQSWYSGVAGRYLDVFDHLDIDEFRRMNEWRRIQVGEQKQTVRATLDNKVLHTVGRALGEDFAVIHPSFMYRLFRRFWWGHAPQAWVRRHTSFSQFCGPGPHIAENAALPREFVAAKFYFNDGFPPTHENRSFVATLLRAIGRVVPVVSLSTGLKLDEHAGCEDVATVDIRHLVGPRNNLEVQSAIVARARAFVGTYGGFSYLAPFLNVPAIGVYSDSGGFSRTHYELALSVFSGWSRGLLQTVSVDDPCVLETVIAGAART